MIDLDKNKAYDLRGLNLEERTELYIYLDKIGNKIKIYDLNDFLCFNNIIKKWQTKTSYHKTKKEIIKAITLFEPTNLEDLGFKPIGCGFYSIHLGRVEISVRKNVYVEDCDGIVELFEYDFEKVKKLVELWK